MRVTAKGQVTIPREIREKAGMLPGTHVTFEIVDGTVHVVKVPAPSGEKSRGQRIVEALRGTGRTGMTTDEIMELTRGPFNDLDWAPDGSDNE